MNVWGGVPLWGFPPHNRNKKTMRQNEKDLINKYIYNNMIRLEDTVKQLQNNVRYRRIDCIDCIELLMAQQELETFKEVTKHIKTLLKI